MPNTSGKSFQRVPDRGTKRYDVGSNLRYAVRRSGQPPIHGTGRLTNLSSSGLLFRCCDSKLVAGDSILAALDWPVKTAADGEAQFLVLTGYVVQVKGLSAAVSISHNDVLRTDDLKKSLELFFGSGNPAASKQGTLPSLTGWNDEEADRYPAISAVFCPHAWPI